MRLPISLVTHAAALLALGAALLGRAALDPLLGDSAPFVLLYGAVAAAVWLGGLVPAVVVALLGYLATDWLFMTPRGALGLAGPADLATLGAYLVTCTIIVGVGAALRCAGRAAMQQGESLRTTLASLADGVLVTDADERVTAINPVAEALTGWTGGSAIGHPLAEVLQRVEDDGEVVVVARDGTRVPVDERAAPLRSLAGGPDGRVLVLRDVRTRRADAARLHESERRLRMALGAARMVAWEHEPASDRLATSGDVAALYGLAPPSRLERGEQRLRLIHSADVEVHRAITRGALERSGSYTSEFRVVRPVDGRVVWMEEHGHAFTAPDGTPRLAGVVTDITERRRDARLLAGQKQVLEMVATGAPLVEVLRALAATIEQHDPSLVCAVLLVDERLRCLRRGAGPGLLDAYVRELEGVPIGPPHRSPCAAAADTGREAVVADIESDPRWAGPWRRQALRHGLRACRAVPVRLSDGRVAAVLATYRREPEGQRALDPRLISVATQLLGIVIERQRTADAQAGDLAAMTRLQALSTRLVRAGELPPLLQEILAAATALSGTDKGDIRLVDAATGRLGLVVQQRLGRRLAEQLAAGAPAPEDWPMGGAQRLVIEDLETDGGPLRDAALEDGVRALQCTPLVSRDGRLLGLLDTYFRTPQRPDERALRTLDLLARMAADFIERHHAEQALRDADRRKDEFLATLAHELRNPLAPMRHAVELLQRRDLDAGVLGETAAMLERQVRQLVRLVDDLLDVNRVSRGRILLRPQRIELASVVTQAVEAAMPMLRARSHELQVTLPPEALPLQGDAARLVQVLGNLLSNASKFSDPGSGIALLVERDGDTAVLRVRDAGIGLEPGQLRRIFELFVQVDTSLERTTSGLGIGLTLAQRLVELHGGTLHAHSEGLGRGSEFVVRLPLLAAAPPPPVVVPPPRPALRHARHVLVVDDNVDGARSLAELLCVLGHRADVAHDGATALVLAERLRPDVVLLDIGLPGMNGHDVSRRLRAEPWGERLLIVAVTGWGQAADRERSRNAGIDAHLVKPVDIDALLALMVTLRPAPASG